MKKWRKIMLVILSSLVIVEFAWFLNVYYINHGTLDGFWNILIGG